MSNRVLSLAIVVLLALGVVWSLQGRRATPEPDLRIQAIRQLSLERVMGVNPEFHGRDVTLKGTVASEDEKQRAERVVASVEGVGEVTNALEVGVLHKPIPLRYFVDLAWRSEGINLRGRLPDEATKALFLSTAAEDFGAELVTDRLEVAADLGSGDWLSRLAPLLPVLTAAVSPGRMKAAGNRVVLVGAMATEEGRRELEEAVRQGMPGFEVESHLKVGEAAEEGS